MELHLVHTSEADEVLVVAALVKGGDWNPTVAPVFDSLPSPGEQRLSFALDRLLPRDSRSYRYRGSFTTPPYQGGVRWLLMAEPIEMAHHQIESFRQLFPAGNARPVQSLGARVVGWG